MASASETWHKMPKAGFDGILLAALDGLVLGFVRQGVASEGTRRG